MTPRDEQQVFRDIVEFPDIIRGQVRHDIGMFGFADDISLCRFVITKDTYIGPLTTIIFLAGFAVLIIHGVQYVIPVASSKRVICEWSSAAYAPSANHKQYICKIYLTLMPFVVKLM